VAEDYERERKKINRFGFLQRKRKGRQMRNKKKGKDTE
jgi:hypothetical protein